MILALTIVACILLLLAALNWPNPSPVSLGWLGLFFWALSTVWGKF